jgi:hypothetical protein
MALIAVLALVAVPGPVGSRGPSPASALDPALFKRAEVAAAVGGPAMTTQPLDPAARSAGNLDPTSTLVEPAPRNESPQTRSRAAQPQPRVGSFVRNAWRLDPELSWYGPGFYGNRTACGHAMTRSLVGVAHKTLPCGTRITFRNPANGRTVTMPVVDRGPYVPGRQWDLTGGACLALDHCYTGPIQWKFAGD